MRVRNEEYVAEVKASVLLSYLSTQLDRNLNAEAVHRRYQHINVKRSTLYVNMNVNKQHCRFWSKTNSKLKL